MSPEQEPGEPAWPKHALDAEAVRAWIAAALPGHPDVAGPTLVHRAQAWGVTARFAVGRGPAREEVVFKASFLPPAFTVAAPYRLLERCCPGHVPELLAWADEPGRRWLLFRAFAGRVVGTLDGLEPLLAVARAMARIQAGAADFASHPFGLPRVPVERIPALFDELVADVRDRYLGDWRERAGEPAIPTDVVERLARFRPEVAAWAAELAGGDWPLSIHHVDLHPNNAVLLPDGEVLIYDWEEADLGVPFFSLDKLLLAAEERGGDPASAGAAVRAAYLEALPWGTGPERERAFDVAQRLAPIRHAAADKRFAEAMGWNPAEPVATWVRLALARWGEGR